LSYGTMRRRLELAVRLLGRHVLPG